MQTHPVFDIHQVTCLVFLLVDQALCTVTLLYRLYVCYHRHSPPFLLQLLFSLQYRWLPMGDCFLSRSNWIYPIKINIEIKILWNEQGNHVGTLHGRELVTTVDWSSSNKQFSENTMHGVYMKVPNLKRTGWHVQITRRVPKERNIKIQTVFINVLVHRRGAHSGAVGWGTALQAGRLRVRFPMVSLKFFIDIILLALGLTQPLTEMSNRDISWGVQQVVCRADNLTTLMCGLSWNMGASTSWNPQGLSRSVMGLLYLCS